MTDCWKKEQISARENEWTWRDERVEAARIANDESCMVMMSSEQSEASATLEDSDPSRLRWPTIRENEAFVLYRLSDFYKQSNTG